MVALCCTMLHCFPLAMICHDLPCTFEFFWGTRCCGWFPFLWAPLVGQWFVFMPLSHVRLLSDVISKRIFTWMQGWSKLLSLYPVHNQAQIGTQSKSKTVQTAVSGGLWHWEILPNVHMFSLSYTQFILIRSDSIWFDLIRLILSLWGDVEMSGQIWPGSVSPRPQENAEAFERRLEDQLRWAHFVASGHVQKGKWKNVKEC
jgi:hypothetical protein